MVVKDSSWEGVPVLTSTEEDQLALYAGFACKVYQLNDWVERGQMTAEQAMDRIGVLVGELKARGYTREGDVE